MSDLVKLRKYVATVEETHHDGGPVLARAVTKAVVGGVVANPYAGRHVADIQPMMKALEPLAVDLTERVMKLLGAKGSDLEAYGKGGFAFADMSHRGSLLCLPDSIWAWPVTRPQDIDEYSLQKVFAAANAIDTLIVGTGTEVWVPPKGLREALRAVRVVLDPMQTGPAIRTYNIMIGERRRVAAALIAVAIWGVSGAPQMAHTSAPTHLARAR